MKAIFSVLLASLLANVGLAQVPALSSNPSAEPTIFLDFDGHYVNGTVWNWSGPITAKPSGLSDAAVIEIFNRVAEDYRIFDVNITTDSTVYLAAPLNRRVRIIITPTYEWYGQAGGVAMVNSFTWGNNTPGWVFSNLLANVPKNVAEAASHEAGHTLGLQHQSSYDESCNKTAEYAEGKGSGEIGWAPIMGVGYYKNLTTWSTGTSTLGCDKIQTDIDVISDGHNGFTIRTDDHGNTPETSSTMLFDGVNFSANGMINTETDKDMFQFDLSSSSSFRLNAIPQSVGTGNNGANLDIKISLLNAARDTLGSYNPGSLLSAGFDTTLSTGRYYIQVDGVSNENLSEQGSVGYYTLAGSMGMVLPVRKFLLDGKVDNDIQSLQWSYQTDEPIKELELQLSTDGSHFQPLVTLGADSKGFSTKSFNKNGISYYRLRAVTVDEERSYYSNIIALRDNKSAGGPDILSTVVSNQIRIQSTETCQYQLFDETGRLLLRGSIQQGYNQINVSGIRKGLLLLRLQGSSQQYTEKLIKQ